MKTITFSRPASGFKGDDIRMNVQRGKASKDRVFLGSLYLDFPMQDRNKDLFSKCTPIEIIQCIEYVRVYNKLRRTMGSSNQDMETFSVHLNQKLPDALYEIAERASESNIDFYPQDILMEALLSKIEEVSHKIDINDILSKYNLCPDYRKNIAPIPTLELQQKLIQAVLNIQDDPQQVVRIFNDTLTQHYGKSKHFTFEWLTDLATGKSTERIKSFWLSTCIDVLQLYGVNPYKLFPAHFIFEYWLSPRLKKYAIHDALKQFIVEFEIPESEVESLLQVATDLYSKPILETHVSILN